MAQRRVRACSADVRLGVALRAAVAVERRTEAFAFFDLSRDGIYFGKDLACLREKRLLIGAQAIKGATSSSIASARSRIDDRRCYLERDIVASIVIGGRGTRCRRASRPYAYTRE